MARLFALLLALCPPALAAQQPLRRAAALSSDAASARDAEAAGALSGKALESEDAGPGDASLPVYAPASASAAPAASQEQRQASSSGPDSALDPLAPPVPISALRARHRGERAAARAARSAAYGTAGFLAGLAAGWLLGGAAAAAFLIRTPNPKLKTAKWFLLAPATAVMAVVGEVSMPFALAKVFSQAEPYDR